MGEAFFAYAVGRGCVCGRFSLFATPDVLARRFGIVDVPVYVPRYNIAPTQEVVVVQPGKDPAAPRGAQAMSWGLPKDEGGPLVINARAETVGERPMFAQAFRDRRVLVPADGFFEWKETGGRKSPHWFTVADEGPFAIAGVWSPSPGKTADSNKRLVLLTTQANPVVAKVHDRMPVILKRENEDRWLDPRTDLEVLQGLLHPYPDEMQVRQVSRRVNRSGVEGADLIEPDSQTRLF